MGRLHRLGQCRRHQAPEWGRRPILYNPNFYFQVDKGTFGLDEVDGQRQFQQPHAFWLVLEGFTPNAVASAGIVPSIVPSLPGVTVTVGAAQPEISSAALTRRSGSLPCSVDLRRLGHQDRRRTGGIFPPPGNPPHSRPRSCCWPHRSPSPGRLLPPAEATLAARTRAPTRTSPTSPTMAMFYLSQDLRVFTVDPGHHRR